MNKSKQSKNVVYVDRNAAGEIVSVSRVAGSDAAEKKSAADAEVLAFLQDLSPGHAAFIESDLSLIRVVEDLIDVLIHKEMLRLTDLPDRVQAKLLERRKLRGSLSSLNLLSDEDESI